MSNGTNPGGNYSPHYDANAAAVVGSGQATGKIENYPCGSPERRAEYAKRNWATDWTLDPANCKENKNNTGGTINQELTPITSPVEGANTNNMKADPITPASTTPAAKFDFGSAMGNAAKQDPGAFAQIAQGQTKMITSLIGGGARRREQARANKELKQRKQAYEDFEMKNIYEDLTNPYEDLKVNTQQAEFEAQQAQQGLSNTLGSLSATAGGSGIAALAQTLAGQQAMNIQRAGASIGMQESRNELRRASGAGQVQMQKAAGEARVQEFELGRTVNLFEQASIRKEKADAARKKATEDLVGGISDTVVGVGRVAAAVVTKDPSFL